MLRIRSASLNILFWVGLEPTKVLFLQGRNKKNIFVRFLVQMKTSKAFEIYWLLKGPKISSPHYLSLLWIFSIVCNVIVHHNNYILIGYSVFVNNLVGMAYVSLMPIIPITIATSDQDDPDFSAIGNFIFRRQIWTLYRRNQLIILGRIFLSTPSASLNEIPIGEVYQ